MQCREMFTREFAKQHLGKSYVKSHLVKEIREREVSAQRNALPSAQADVDWELARRSIISQRRFGDTTPIPPRPESLKDYGEQGYACPKGDCRGFVHSSHDENGKSSRRCGLCKSLACSSCRETLEEGHECNPETLESLKFLKSDAKPCPTCKTLIHRTEGCDHMKCTLCGTHFNYKTLHKLKNSTNHHYNRTEHMISRAGTSRVETCVEEDDVEGDGIPRNVFAGDADLVPLLYGDRDCIQKIRDTMFNEVKIMRKSESVLHDARVRYLLKEISEKYWISKITRTLESREGDIARATMMDVLLVELRDMQRSAHSRDSQDIKERHVALFKMVDENLIDIREAFGGVVVRMRQAGDPIGTPPIKIA